MNLPSISVLIPTLNSEATLGECLDSIASQDYPAELVEVIVADGGSRDETCEIANAHGGRLVSNPLRTGEAGKAAALRHSSHDLVALIDSDNILPQRDWFRRMVAPLVDDEAVVGTEPWKFTRRSGDPAFTRYCAMLGMNDPVCHFIGNYDRMNLLTGRWTSLPIRVEDRGGYLIFNLGSGPMPTIGANGTIWRRRSLEPWADRDYLFDIDVLGELAKGGAVRFAKVKVGIVHIYAVGLRQFADKQRRRVRDYLSFRCATGRTYPWESHTRTGIARFVLASVAVIPLLIDTVRGYRRSRDFAWLLHAPACWLTLAVYGSELILHQLAGRTRNQ